MASPCPGGGTYGMEAVARQFAAGPCVGRAQRLVFLPLEPDFRSRLNSGQATVMKARQAGNGTRAPFAPAPIEEVVAAIREAKPDVVFAPHVETSAA